MHAIVPTLTAIFGRVVSLCRERKVKSYLYFEKAVLIVRWFRIGKTDRGSANVTSPGHSSLAGPRNAN